MIALIIIELGALIALGFVVVLYLRAKRQTTDPVKLQRYRMGIALEIGWVVLILVRLLLHAYN